PGALGCKRIALGELEQTELKTRAVQRRLDAERTRKGNLSFLEIARTGEVPRQEHPSLRGAGRQLQGAPQVLHGPNAVATAGRLQRQPEQLVGIEVFRLGRYGRTPLRTV